MAEQLRQLIHEFEFAEENRSGVSFSNNVLIWLDGKQHLVKLRQNAATFRYTIESDTGGQDIYAISEPFAPGAWRAWIGFEAVIDHDRVGGTEFDTSDGFRLHDGTDQFYWNGSAWVINAVNWNTEAEVATNIAAFTGSTLRVVVNLRTTDPNLTPILKSLKVSWSGKIHFLEDVVYRSLVPAMRAGCRFLTDYEFAGSGSVTVDVGAALVATAIPFKVIDVDSAFNHTTDPNHLTNLASSYDAGTRILTLTGAVPANERIFLQLLVEPAIQVRGRSQDFIEVEQTPTLILRQMKPAPGVRLGTPSHVVDKVGNSAIQLPAPYRNTLRFDMMLVAPGGVDLIRFHEAVVEFFHQSPILRAVGMDRGYDLVLLDEPEESTVPHRSDARSAKGAFEIRNVLVWSRPAVAVPVVLRLVLGRDMSVVAPPNPT